MIMKLATLLPAALIAYSGASEVAMNVGSCGDLQAAAAATGTSRVLAVMTNGFIECDSLTTIEIMNYRLKIVNSEDASSEEFRYGLNLDNVRFLVGSGGLRVDPEVFIYGGDFDSDDLTPFMVNGGLLNVAEGARVRFMSTVHLGLMTISSVGADGSDATWHGGCVYNQGLIRFEGTAQIYECYTTGGGGSEPGDGSGIWNGPAGEIVAKGIFGMDSNGEYGEEGIRGGAIYNAGKISLFGSSGFLYNYGGAGGAIYNEGEIKFLGGSEPNLEGNEVTGDGGHIFNSGDLTFRADSSFELGYAEGSGGAIFNSGELTMFKSPSFSSNSAGLNGGAIFSSGPSLVILESAVYSDNSAGGDCENIYLEDDAGFVCLPPSSR